MHISFLNKILFFVRPGRRRFQSFKFFLNRQIGSSHRVAKSPHIGPETFKHKSLH